MNETDTVSRVNFHEGSIALPAGFDDRTANVFVPADPQRQPNLSIARDRLRDGETLSRYVDRQLAELKSRLAQHRLLDRRAAVLGPPENGLPGECIEASYRNGTLTIHQRQAAFALDDRRVLVFTASSPRGAGPAFDSLWSQWLASCAVAPCSKPLV